MIFILFFMAFSICAFIFSNIWVLVGFSVFDLLIILIFKIKPKKLFKFILNISIFTIFVFLFNLIFDNLINSLIVSWKIIIVSIFAFVFSSVISKTKIAEGIARLFYPLKLFKIDPNDIALMLVISLNFITIISEEAKTLKMALRARNVKLSFKTIFTKSHIIFITFFAGLLKKVTQIEESLIIRKKKV